MGLGGVVDIDDVGDVVVDVDDVVVVGIWQPLTPDTTSRRFSSK